MLKPHHRHRRERADDRHRHSRRRNQRRAPVLQENHDHDQDEHARLEQRAINLADGLRHERGGVEWDLVSQPLRESRSEAVEKLPHTLARYRARWLRAAGRSRCRRPGLPSTLKTWL